MVLRIFIPLYLVMLTFLLSLGGMIHANEASSLEKMFEDSLNRLAEAQAEVGIYRILNLKADNLTDDEKKELASSLLKHSEDFGHDPFLLLALIDTESSFKRRAMSDHGAMGLMQVRPFVARGLAEEMNLHPNKAARLYDMDMNLKVGSYYLRKMIERYGSLRLALEAYNLGPTTLDNRLENGDRIGWTFARKVINTRNRFQKIAQMEDVNA